MGDFETPSYIMTNTGFSENNFSLKAGLNRIDYGFDIYYSYFGNFLGILRSSHAHTAIDIINAIQTIALETRVSFSSDGPIVNGNKIMIAIIKTIMFIKLFIDRI